MSGRASKICIEVQYASMPEEHEEVYRAGVLLLLQILKGENDVLAEFGDLDVSDQSGGGFSALFPVEVDPAG